jgi:hypothetical protein
MGETLTFENAVKIGMDFAGRVKAMTDGQVLLTGEFPDVYVLDHLLSSHYGTEAPSDELKDFALASGVYVAVLLARFWTASGLQSFWREQGIADCGIGLELTGEDQKGHEFFLTCPADVYGMVTQPPNPFPQFVGGWMTLRKGDPLLPRYVLGALLLSQPLAHGDWPKLPPGEGAFLQGHLSRMIEITALSCARDLYPEDGLPRRILESFYECCLWPPVGAFANDYGVENIRALAAKMAFSGMENRTSVMEALDAMEKGWVSDGAYIAGLASRALRCRDDVPAERMGFTVPEARDVLQETGRIFKDALPGWSAA